METESSLAGHRAKRFSPWPAGLAGLFLLFAGFFIFHVSMWTDRRAVLPAGLINGAVMTLSVAIPYLVWCLFVGFLCRTRLQSWRTALLLAPALLLFAWLNFPLLRGLPGPETTFPHLMRMPLPQDAENMRYYYRGGGITDSTVVYCFETSSTEVEKLIRGADIRERRSWTPESVDSFPVWPFPDPPELQKWSGSDYYQQREGRAFRHLIINSERRSVFAFYGTY